MSQKYSNNASNSSFPSKIDSSDIGIVFDLDGTLMDNVPIFLNLPLDLAKHYNVEITEDQKDLLQQIIKDGIGGKNGKFFIISMIWGTAKKLGIPFFQRFGFLKTAGNLYRTKIAESKIIPYSAETIDLIVSKYHTQIGICTTSSQAEIAERFKTRKEFISRFDNNIICRDDVKKLKPSPEGILKLSTKWDKFGINPSRIIMIGDMNVDIEAGKAAGAITVGVLTGFSNQIQMEKYGADFIIETIAKLPEIMDGIIKRIHS
jgi:phosphoglycolate phosphatase-like HAD superfamily hydrolase